MEKHIADNLKEAQGYIRDAICLTIAAKNYGLSTYWTGQLDKAFCILEKVDMHYDKLIVKEPEGR